MREHDFRVWMDESGNAPSTTQTRTSGIRRVERDEGIDVDEEFQKDGMKSLLELFRYTSNDTRANRPNPTKLKIATESLQRDISWFAGHLRKYRDFCLSKGDSATYVKPAPIARELRTHAPADTSTRPKKTKPLKTSDSNSVFALEAHLQAALRENIAQLDPDLEIIDGGGERRVQSGFIDIMARDKAGCHVVIELKAGMARDAVVAQTLGYMNDVKDEDEKEVRGIIVAADFNKRVRSAAEHIPNLILKSYRYDLGFKTETHN